MKTHAARAVALLAPLCIALGGCGDTAAPVAPDAPRIRATAAQRSLAGGVLLKVIQRSRPLAEDHTAEAMIGEAGGVIEIPEAGFSITFPAGAVRGEPVAIRATALKGADVAYRFEPHGLVFGAEPVISQDLGVTEAAARLLSFRRPEGGYVENPALLAGGTAAVLETRPAHLDLVRMRMTFGIRHFSEYVASTERGGYIGSSGEVVPADEQPELEPGGETGGETEETAPAAQQ